MLAGAQALNCRSVTSRSDIDPDIDIIQSFMPRLCISAELEAPKVNVHNHQCLGH